MLRWFYIGVSQLALVTTTFADENAGVFDGSTIDSKDLRSGNISFADIPSAIQTITTFLLGFAASISMIMLIVGALQYSLASVDQNKKKAVDTITYSIIGFIVSASAWFIVRTIIANL